MRRRLIAEIFEALGNICSDGQTVFTTKEIAEKIGIKAWRVRRSLKSVASDVLAPWWSEGDDKWHIDPKLVSLFALLSGKY